MSLPKVLQVVVIVHRSSALNLGQHTSPRIHPVEEVGPGRSNEAILGRQDHLLLKPESITEKYGDDRLNHTALRTMDMSGPDFLIVSGQVANKLFSQEVNGEQLETFFRGHARPHESRELNPHGSQLRS